MKREIKREDKFEYLEFGEGEPIIILHGLMGDLSNFDSTISFLGKTGYKVLMPVLPLYSTSILQIGVKFLANFIRDFIAFKALDEVVLLGNSLGGHIALLYSVICPDNVKALVLVSSSGLYEKRMTNSFPHRKSYDYVKKKTREVFYNPDIATEELTSRIFDISQDRKKVISTIAISKSAMRHNISDELPNIKAPTCIIWGENDIVTPLNVAEEFHTLLPNSDLYLLDKCGHAPMMEHPELFNDILGKWLSEKIFHKCEQL
ncbi:alpha/beta fold hydrolase [Ichthyobacterium seriolicida]|uniref:Alpha/beta hydrolase n=1 Tax=Ichthyobacterium seriolicida TaxID=242600 RepID=A0A1J1E5S1_9FLAO|nr:alpha/beta hydrolase [Ichthyobacterium seriolicida]BAV95404.1 alpha/beta hydrolase [Ichthyobacterium seriolicida]